ncbi:MAG: hypothetical protein ACI4AH_04595 [Muribaculaceae bacterium]
MKQYTNIITVSIDIENLLKSVYAESAWLKATNLTAGTDSPLLNPDRRAMAMMLLGEAYAELCTSIGAYITGSNANSFADDGMLKMELRYSSRSHSDATIGLSTMMSQTLACHILSLAYPSMPYYDKRYSHHKRALLTTLARAEQA